MPNVHPPLSSYRPGDRAVITCRGHRFEGEEVEVMRAYNDLDIYVRRVGGVWSDYFSNNASLSPVRPITKRPISPIFYSLQM